MENEMRHFDIDYNFYWEGTVPISKLKSDIAALEALGATHISFECEQDYDLWLVKTEASGFRVETDEEMEQRRRENKERWGFLGNWD